MKMRLTLDFVDCSQALPDMNRPVLLALTEEDNQISLLEGFYELQTYHGAPLFVNRSEDHDKVPPVDVVWAYLIP